MTNTASTSNVYINKLEAARRQICAAVHMFFDGEDELAVHTVASAARSIVGNLRQQRGDDEVGYQYLVMVYRMMVEYRRNALPGFLMEDPKIVESIRRTVEELPVVTASTTWEEFKGMVVSVEIPPRKIREYWEDRTRIANFLKHADRDPHGLLALGEVDNQQLLINTIDSYQELVPGSLLSETFALLLFSGSWALDDPRLNSRELDLVAEARQCTESERLTYCAQLLSFLKEVHGES